MVRLVTIALVVCLSAVLALDTLTAQEPHRAVESADDLPSNKFTARTERTLARADASVRSVKEELFGVDYVTNNNGSCDHGVHLAWMQRVGSSIFATPRIVDLHSDARKELFIPTFTQYVEVLDAITGEDVSGFPFTHPHYKSQCSPLPVDLDGDGILEWMVGTYNGELLFLKEDGTVAKVIKIPPLPLKKNWKTRPNGNHSTAEKTLPVSVLQARLLRLINDARGAPAQRRPMPQTFGTPQAPQPMQSAAGGGGPAQRKLLQQSGESAVPLQPDVDLDYGSAPNGDDDIDGDDSIPEEYRGDYDHYLHDMYEGDNPYENDYGAGYDDDDDSGSGPLAQATIGVDGWLSKEARASMDLIFHPELYESSANILPEHDPFAAQNMISDTVVLVQSDEVAVDAHLLATPAVVDMDGDGTLDVVAHVSYFFDAEYYARVENQFSLPEDVNMDDYVADALVCLSLLTGKVLWLKLLHVSTKTVAQPAYALSSPLIININGDLIFDVFVSTALGYIFGFDGRGNPIGGHWPVHMAPILGGVLAEDVNGDGNVDLCAADIRGSVACFHGDGRELWEKHVAGAISDTPTAGDVNGDGFVDVVVGTASGGIYALDGRHGDVLPNFPVLAQGPIVAAVLLVNLNNTAPPAVAESSKGLHLIVPSHDGFLYLISGSTGCYELLDIGEKSDSMVLADDLTGNGVLDLVVTTLAGGVYVYSTETPFTPLKAWPSRIKALNGATASEGHVGVYINEETRTPRDIRGDRFRLMVTIEDHRPGRMRSFTPRYIVTVLIGTRVVVYSGIFLEAKTYTLELHAPLERLYGTVRVVLSLPNGQHYEDSTAMSFNMHFLETIKYLLLAPFLVVALALSFVTKEHTIKAQQYTYVYRRRRLAEVDDEY